MKGVLLCAVLLTWSGLAAAVVYRWTDAQGKIQYGDRPPDGAHAEIVDMPGSHAAGPATSAPPATPPTAAASKPAAHDPAAQDENAKKSVDDDVAQTRQKQCADAQDRYKKLIEGRRLYKAGPDGERQYLSSEEIDSERLNAKRDLDSLCGSPN